MEKIKISHEDLLIFLNVLKQSHEATFVTSLEAKLCIYTIRDLVQSFMEKLIKGKEEYKLNLTKVEMLALDAVLPQLPELDIYSDNVIRSIYQQINIQCLNIS